MVDGLNRVPARFPPQLAGERRKTVVVHGTAGDSGINDQSLL
jgi:hypothetical protein